MTGAAAFPTANAWKKNSVVSHEGFSGQATVLLTVGPAAWVTVEVIAGRLFVTVEVMAGMPAL